MLNRKLAAFIEKSKSQDIYWVERLKLDFALQLEKRRKTMGLSYTDFAKKIGNSAPYVSKVFGGEANLTFESMVKLSRAVGGKIDLKIIDENAVSDPRKWFINAHQHSAAANQPISSTNTILDNAILNNGDDIQKAA